MSLERSLLVRDIPSDVTADHVQLLFESDRFCPAGGRVENVELAITEGSTLATVTFEDSFGNYSAANHIGLN